MNEAKPPRTLIRRQPLQRREVTHAGQAMLQNVEVRRAQEQATKPSTHPPSSQKLSLFESELLTAWALE